MKFKYLSMFSVIALLVAIVGCTNDETVQNYSKSEMNSKGMTEFTMTTNIRDFSINASLLTRTKGVYTGSGIKFYWTSNDQLWINNTTLKLSSHSDIPTTNAEKETAKFWFEGTYTASTYPVRYTGNGNSVGDKVTIKAAQTQQTPNDGSHIGTDGDCGTAIAMKNGERYEFMLEHKASYITFAPFYTKDNLANSVTVKQIKVTADKDIAGTYDFDDNGLNTAAVTGGSKSITLKLDGTFNIPTASDYTKNGAIMVIAPGTYNTFTVEYTLSDTKTGVTGTVSKTYNDVTFKPGYNKTVKYDLEMKRYEAKYYMWDAKKDYWNDYTGTLPLVNGERAPFPTGGGDREYNKNVHNLNEAFQSCAGCPNINQMSYYIWHGNPHWDGELLWTKLGQIYQGGMWFLKKDKISGFKASQYSNGTDYRSNSNWKTWNENDPYWQKTPASGKPSNINDCFFLPAMGYVNAGTLNMNLDGYYGAYWTATPVLGDDTTYRALLLHFSPTVVGIEVDARFFIYPIFEVQ